MRNSNIASTALLYQNRTELEQFIQEYCLPARREDSSWLVMIHTSCHTPEGAVAIAKQRIRTFAGCKNSRHKCICGHLITAAYMRTAAC